MSRKKKIKEYDALLQSYIDNKECIKVYRTLYNNEDNLSGFILKMSEYFLLMQIENDFLFDGYAIIRKDDFDSVRCNKYDNTSKKILQAEGLLDAYGINVDIPLTNWGDIFQSLSDADYHVIVESDNKKMNCLDFNIGEIKETKKKSVSIHYYDPTGRLDKKPTKIKFDKIRIIKFGDRYSTVFRKYLRQPKKNKQQN